MTTYPTSRDGRSRQECRASVPPLIPSGLPPERLWRTDQRLLQLLGQHQVLTSGHLVRLGGLPERTVQHRLRRLYRAGLINRSRPPAPVGSPYHCWLTGCGAAVIGAKSPEPWSDDPAGMVATAGLSDLWLGVRDHGPAADVHLQDWRRLDAGVGYEDPFTGAGQVLPVEAELIVALGTVSGEQVTVLVAARAAQAPVARLQAVLARFAAYLRAPCNPEFPPVLALLVGASRHAARILGIIDELSGAPACRRLAPSVLTTAREHVVVGVLGPRQAALLTAPVWCRAAERSWRCLSEVLAVATGSCR